MEQRERVPAAVILIVFIIGATVIYLVTLPAPIAYSLVFGNFSQQTSTVNNTSVPKGAFYAPITTYVGGNPSAQSTSYSFGTFGASYNEYNSTLSSTSPFTLSASLFGSSSYNVGFNGSSADSYFVTINISSVSGSPKITVLLNGNSFYSTLPSDNEQIVLRVPGARNGNNVLSIQVSLNGFAFSQSASFNGVSITQMFQNNASHYVSATIPTFSGIGNFYLQYTPIGTGNMTISVNGEVMQRISQASDNPVNITIPPSIVNQAISPGTSPILPVTFDLGFTVGPKSTYELANVGLVYQVPQIASNNITLPFSVPTTTGNYILTLYISSIIKQGQVSFSVYPSGATFSIPAANLATGENILILPYSDFQGQQAGGDYSGTITIKSDGLVIPQYIELKSTS